MSDNDQNQGQIQPEDLQNMDYEQQQDLLQQQQAYQQQMEQQQMMGGEGQYNDEEEKEEFDDEEQYGDEENKQDDEEEDEEAEQDNMAQYMKQEELVLQWCAENGKEWEDPDFPADNRALFKDPNIRPEWSQDSRNIKWKRPQEIANTPKFMIDRHGDYKQGGLGESQFIGAIIIIATRGELLEQLFVETSHFDKGFVSFQFYKNGQWKQVMVDTKLPWDEDSKQILFTYCANPQEFWIPLMEKAYSKLHGCYENICDGYITEMLVDLSGGVSEDWHLNDPETSKMIENDQLWVKMMQYFNNKFYIGCVNHIDGKGTKNADTGTHGILENHHYGICDIRAFPKEGLKLIRIRNVWGSDGGWNGPFCDDSEEWDKHRSLRTELNLAFKNKKSEGTWWMSYNDWFVHFNNLFVCKVFPESWESYSIDSKWQGKSQGGICPERADFAQYNIKEPIPEYLQLDSDDRWFNNPQFRLKVTKETKLYISLMLEDKKLSKQEYVQTNFMVITNKNRNNRIWERPQNQDIVIEGNPGGEKPAQREITEQVTLKKFEGKNYGYYVIIPNMIIQGKDILKKDNKRVFYLRVFSSDPIDVTEMDETEEISVEGQWSDNNNGGRRKIIEMDKKDEKGNIKKEVTQNPYWCQNPQYFLNLSQPTHLKIILQKTGNLRKTKGIKTGLSICRYDAPKDQRTQQKEKNLVPVKKATQGQAQGSNLARLLQQTDQQLEPPVLDIIERKLQIAYGEKFKESIYQSDESSALYFSWNPTEGPFVILPSLETKDKTKTSTYKLTIYSNNPVELRQLDESKNAVLIGSWGDSTDGGCHLYEEEQTWTQNPQYILKFNENKPAYLKITLAIAEWTKKTNNTVERMIGIYLINKVENNAIKYENVVKEPNFLPLNSFYEEFYLTQINENGYYIMPCTYKNKITGTFILSVTSDQEFTLVENK